jgi:outer membrane protein assembly factor BamB
MEGWGPGLTSNNGLELTLSTSNAANLKQHWSTPDVFQGPPVASGTTAYEVGSEIREPVLFAFDTTTGKQLWSTTLAPAIGQWESPDSPLVGNLALGGNGLVFVDLSQAPSASGAPPSEVVALNASNGSIVWTDQQFAGVSFVGALTMAPFVRQFDGAVQSELLAATNGNYVSALDPATGNVLWSSASGLYNSSVAVGNGLGYAVGSDDKLYALDLTSGGLKWVSQLISPSCSGADKHPVVAGNEVIASSVCNGQFAAFDAAMGNLVWRTPNLGPIGPFSAAVSGNNVYVGEDNGAGGGTLYGLALQNGSVVWKTPLAREPIWSPFVANGVVYLVEADRLLITDQTNGKQLLTLPSSTGDLAFSAAIISDGQVLWEGAGMGLRSYGL